MKIKCPKCGSEDVVIEIKSNIRFKFNKRGNIKIVSDRQDIIGEIYSKIFGGLNCECQKCGDKFPTFAK